MAKAQKKEVEVEETITEAPKPRGRQVPHPNMTKAMTARLDKMTADNASTSDKIRYLATAWKHDHTDNNVTSAIAKELGIVYQYARGVLTRPLKRPPLNQTITK